MSKPSIPPGAMGEDDMLALLAAECAAAGSMNKWAKRHGVAVAYVSMVLRRRAQAGDKILSALPPAPRGLRRVHAYVAADS